MMLCDQLIRSGNWLFKRRGYLPLILLPLILIAIWTSSRPELMQTRNILWKVLCLAMILAGTFLRFWVVGQTPKGTSGRNTSGQVAEALNTEGPYSLVRHPLYVGNFLVMLGIVSWAGNEWLMALFAALYCLYYERIMLAEEEFLRSKYEPELQKWAQKVPAVLPRFSCYHKSLLPFSYKAVLRREYNGIFNTLFALFIVDSLIQSRLSGHWKLSDELGWAMLFFLLVALILKSVKKYTGLLQESNRS